MCTLPPPGPVKITIGTVTRPLPALGLCAAADAGRLDERSLRRLSALKLAHLRVDLRSTGDAGLVHAADSFAEAVRMGCRVELAVHLDDKDDERQAGAFLAALAGVLKEAGVSVARVLVFGFGSGYCTSAAGLRIVRRHLGAFQAPVGGGSAADLYQFNLNRPPPDVDLVCWGMNPQVHAFDNGSIAETPEAAGQQVASVGVYFPGKTRAVSPVTLKPRFNPVAHSGEQRDAPGELPASVDVRQLSLFGAAWTLAMLKALAEAGAESLTFYEASGWRGVMQPASGSRLPGKFPSFAGSVFPLYHVLADAGEFAEGEVVATQSSDPLEIAPLFLRAGERRRLIVANLCPEPREVELPKLGGVLRMRALDESTGLAAMTAPEEFRLQQEPFRGSRVALAPYAVLTLDSIEN